MTWRWLATLCLVKPSTFINSNIREGMAWSIPNCSTAFTNFLCSSGVQSTWTKTKYKKCNQISILVDQKYSQNDNSKEKINKQHKNIIFHKRILHMFSLITQSMQIQHVGSIDQLYKIMEIICIYIPYQCHRYKLHEHV
jgi:hypothetical protein